MSVSAILQPNQIYDLYARSFTGSQGNFNGISNKGQASTFFMAGPIIWDGDTTATAAQTINAMWSSSVSSAITLPSASDVFAYLGNRNIYVGATFYLYPLSFSANPVSVVDSSDGTFTGSLLTQGSLGFCTIVNTNPLTTPAIVINA